MTIRTISVLTFLVLLLAPPASAATKHDYRTPDKKWIKGPVRWIMSPVELKEFKRLKSDEERAAFARSFWEKRDPTPDTPANEYEIIFWQRVESANKAYRSMTEAGSVTDRGRVFILLGPPATTSKDSRNRSTWTYEPNPVTGINESLEFKFAPSSTGGGDNLLRRKTLEVYVSAHPETRGIGWEIPVLEPAADALQPQMAAAPEPEEDLSPESQRQIPILEAILARGSGPADVPFRVTRDFYAAQDGSTLVALTVEIPREAAHGSGDVALLPFGRLEPEGGEGRPVNLTGIIPFIPASTADSPPTSFIYQARRNLRPGTYRLAIVVEDRVIAGQMGTLVETLEVPDYSGRQFDMSSLSLIARFRPIEVGLGPEEEPRAAGPFVLGSFRMVPRANPVLQLDEALTFYYQVYNPARDPTSGRPNLEATYSFYLKEGGAWKPFRRPIQKTQGQVELYSIDLKDLLRPDQVLPADFRMVARLQDKVGGGELTRDLLFTVQ